MKKWIAIGLAACLALMTGTVALAEDDADATEASVLPAPEEVAEIEAADDEDTEAAPEQGDDEGEVAGAALETETTGIPEAEPTETPVPEESGSVEVWFEEGFALSLPEGWVSYDVSDEDREDGIRYSLGDGSGERMLYIQLKSTRIQDVGALGEAVENTDGLSKTGDLSFGDTDFVAFIDSRQNASCCATLWGSDLVVFIFTPQTDSDFMLTASQIMESFDIL